MFGSCRADVGIEVRERGSRRARDWHASGAVADRILHPGADLHARLGEPHPRAAAAGDHGYAGRRRQSHRHASRRCACRLRTRRPGARGMAARPLAFRDPAAERLGDPHRHGVGRRGVAAVAPRNGALDDVDVDGDRRPGRRRRPQQPPRRAPGRSGPSRARRGRRPRTADPSPRVPCAGRSRASGHTSQWRVGRRLLRCGPGFRSAPAGAGPGRGAYPSRSPGRQLRRSTRGRAPDTHGSGASVLHARAGRRRPAARAVAA